MNIHKGIITALLCLSPSVVMGDNAEMPSATASPNARAGEAAANGPKQFTDLVKLGKTKA